MASMCVGRGVKEFEIWHFLNKILAKKVVCLVSSGQNEILQLLAPAQEIFFATPGKFHHWNPLQKILPTPLCSFLNAAPHSM